MDAPQLKMRERGNAPQLDRMLKRSLRFIQIVGSLAEIIRTYLHRKAGARVQSKCHGIHAAPDPHVTSERVVVYERQRAGECDAYKDAENRMPFLHVFILASKFQRLLRTSGFSYTVCVHTPPLVRSAGAYMYASVLNHARKLVRRSFIERDSVKKRGVEFALYVHLLSLYVRSITRLEKKDARFIQAVQELRLRRIIAHARRAPWWRDYFRRSGVEPGDIRTISDMERLPVITRADISYIPKRLLFSRQVRDQSLQWGVSSGSTTGTPLQWAFEKSLLRFDTLAFYFNQYYSYGLSFRALSARNFQAYVNRPLMHQRDAFHFFRAGSFGITRDDVEVDAHIREMADALAATGGGCTLATSPSAMFFLVQKWRALGLRPHFLFCLFGGFPVMETEREARDAAEEYLGCPVRELYGAQEFDCLARECKTKAGYMHIHSGRVIIEIVDEDGIKVPYGAVGRVVITSLDNTIMPLLRYEIGDRGVMMPAAPCACGNSSPLLRLEGRVTDFIHMRGGSKLYPKELFVMLARRFSFARAHRIQVRQESIDRLAVLVETPFLLEPATLREVERFIERAYRNAFSINIQRVEHIPEEGLKFKPFVPLQHSKEKLA